MVKTTTAQTPNLNTIKNPYHAIWTLLKEENFKIKPTFNSDPSTHYQSIPIHCSSTATLNPIQFTTQRMDCKAVAQLSKSWCPWMSRHKTGWFLEDGMRMDDSYSTFDGSKRFLSASETASLVVLLASSKMARPASTALSSPESIFFSCLRARGRMNL